MRKYAFEFSRHADRQFAVLEPTLQRRILKKLAEYERHPNPLQHAVKLTGTNYYRFRIGDYRIICSKKDRETLTILVILRIGHRREIYE